MLTRKEFVKYTFERIMHRKARTFLTILSIFFGIAVIFVFVSFGFGLYKYIEDISSESTADKVSIMPKGMGAPGMDDTFSLTEEDIKAIEKTRGVYEVSGFYFKSAEIVQDKNKLYTFVIGLTPENSMFFEMMGIGIAEGRALEKNDRGKAVLGYNYMFDNKNLPKAYSLNDKIKIQGKEFKVIGFYEAVGSPPDDAQIYITEEDLKELYGNELKGYAMAIARVDTINIDSVIQEIEKNLRKSRNLEKGKEDFFVQSWQDMIETYTMILDIIVGFVILIALISVVVSAINTANTMITSVLERVKEIGVMKAVGAKNSDIFKLFLFESAFLGFIAGIIGVSLGAGISHIIGNVLKNLGWGFLQPYYSWWLFVLLIAFATLTGAISGAIPARYASKIRPVDALRYE